MALQHPPTAALAADRGLACRPITLTRAMLAGLALLASVGCETPAAPGLCGGREVPLRNASSLAIEQAYAGDGSAGGWGTDLLGPTELPPGQTTALRLPAGTRALRLVWVNGRAAELQGMDACAIAGLSLTDRALQADR